LILSEARKYGLTLTIAHQYLNQLSDELRSVVFGNVGSLAALRTGAEGAAILAEQIGLGAVVRCWILEISRGGRGCCAMARRPRPFGLTCRPLPYRGAVRRIV
jgi:hypothetical protein